MPQLVFAWCVCVCVAKGMCAGPCGRHYSGQLCVTRGQGHPHVRSDWLQHFCKDGVAGVDSSSCRLCNQLPQHTTCKKFIAHPAAGTSDATGTRGKAQGVRHKGKGVESGLQLFQRPSFRRAREGIDCIAQMLHMNGLYRFHGAQERRDNCSDECWWVQFEGVACHGSTSFDRMQSP